MKNYIINKPSDLIDQIKTRSQHPQDPARRAGNKCMDELSPHEGILETIRQLKNLPIFEGRGVRV